MTYMGKNSEITYCNSLKMEYSRRISQTRTYTKNVGVNTYTNIKNYTWDCDGQLLGVEAQEPWGFRYDDNGNMLSLTYRFKVFQLMQSK